MNNIAQSTCAMRCQGPDQQTAVFQPLVTDIPINLWGRDLLIQWRTYITIPSIMSQTKQIMTNMGLHPSTPQNLA